MQPDDELCLCFHVSWRKVINYIRVHRVTTPSMVNQCGGAGTGCGWCRKQIVRMTELVNAHPPDPQRLEEWLDEHSPDKQRYASGRDKYREAKGVAGEDLGLRTEE